MGQRYIRNTVSSAAIGRGGIVSTGELLVVSCVSARTNSPHDEFFHLLAWKLKTFHLDIRVICIATNL